MENNRKLFIKQDPQEMLNIIEALQFYKDNMVKSQYKKTIEDQLDRISVQLKIQNINIYCKDYEPEFKIGQFITYDGHNCIVIGQSDKDQFIKIAICNNNEMEVIDIPIALIEK